MWVRIMYWLFYILMSIGYIGLSCQATDLKSKVIGVLLTIVNMVIFWK
jgi:hypothetical protein